MGVITRLQGQAVFPVAYFNDGGLVLCSNRDFSATLYVLTKTTPEPPTRAEVLASGTAIAVQTSKYASAGVKCWMWAASSADCDVEFAPTVRPVLEESETIRGLFNVKGLRRLIEQIPKAMTPGGGGVDVVFGPGDSLLESMGVTSYLDNSIPALFTRLCQAEFNPPGVPGGLGLVPVRSGNADNLWDWGGLTVLNSVRNMIWAANNTVANTAAGNAIGRKRTSFSGATNQIRIWLDPTNALPSNRRGVTSVDVVFGQSNGTDSGTITGGTFTWDAHSADAFCAAGASGYALTGTINSNGTPTFGKRTQIGGTLDRTLPYSFQISGPASGTANIDGIICFDGDEATGWRGHNCCRVGASTGDNWTEETLQATIDSWCARTGRATNAYCFVLNLISNDCSAQRDLVTFKTVYGAILDRIISMGCCAIVVIPPVYDQAKLTSPIPYSAYIDVVYQLAAERDDYVVLRDYHRWCGNPTTHTYLEVTMGWVNLAMARHHTDVGAMGHAEDLFACVQEARSVLAVAA